MFFFPLGSISLDNFKILMEKIGKNSLYHMLGKHGKENYNHLIENYDC